MANQDIIKDFPRVGADIVRRAAHCNRPSWPTWPAAAARSAAASARCTPA